MGFFIGKLKRAKVTALYRKDNDFEFPSDFDGVLYKEFDSGGAWKDGLLLELKEAGFDVDANKLM
jgi:predicted nucleotide-binding protein